MTIAGILRKVFTRKIAGARIFAIVEKHCSRFEVYDFSELIKLILNILEKKKFREYYNGKQL